MNPWVTLAIAVGVPSSGLFAVAWQAGRWAGGVNATLAELVEDRNDHETRLRAIEHPETHAARGRRGRG